MKKIKPCSGCKYVNQECSKFTGECCLAFEPEDPIAYAAAVMDELKNSITPSHEKYLRRHCITTNGLTHDDRYTLDEYHVAYINSILKTIRSGEEDYVYSIEHLKEIYAFEQNLNLSWSDGCWVVSVGG